SDPFLGGSLAGQGDCAVPQTLGIGGSYMCAVVAPVTGPAGFVHQNTVTAPIEDTQGNTATDHSTVTVNIVDATPDPLVVSKQVVGVDTLVEPGGAFSYEVSVTHPASNTEPVTVTGVDDVRTGAAGASTVDISASCDLSSLGGAFPAALLPGQSFTCAFTADHFGVGGDTFTNVAVVAGTDAQGNDVSGSSAPVTVEILADNTNPNLGRSCGARVIFILDESSSIYAEGATEDVRDAAEAFFTALADTGSELAVIEFAGAARLVIPYTEITNGTGGTLDTVFRDYLTNDYFPLGVTNWQAPLQIAETLNDGPDGVADLVLIFTDGNPNTNEDGFVGEVPALASALPVADAVKAQGSHMFGVGVGGLDLTVENLIAITGPDEWPAASILESDYVLVNNFSDLPEVLAQFSIAFCGGTVEVIKSVEIGDGFEAADGWEFTLDAPVDVLPAASAITGADGRVSFTLETNADHTVTLTETPQFGYGLVSVACTSEGSPVPISVADTSITLDVGRDELITCDFLNSQGADPTLSKVVDANGDGVFGNIETAAPGAPVTFRLTLTNPSLSSITIDDISDAVGGTVRFTAAELVTSVPGYTSCADVVGTTLVANTVVCYFDAFAPGEDDTSEVDTVTVAATNALGEPISVSDDATVEVPDSIPVPLGVVKSGVPLVHPEPGGVTAYSVMVSNPNVESVVVSGVSDDLDGVVTDVSGSCSVSFPHVLVGGWSFTCSFDVDHVGEGGDVFTDVVSVSAADDEGNDA
ncbi:MAG: VWA domain-containing protein, partial [Acidimicrobiia bacterium]|nr:VWA domain-containing protein [Acidimicrobiia bacterium]